MSVRTPADEKRDEAKEHISEAYKCLLDTLNPDTWGSDQFSKEYIATMEESLLMLIRLKRDL